MKKYLILLVLSSPLFAAMQRAQPIPPPLPPAAPETVEVLKAPEPTPAPQAKAIAGEDAAVCVGAKIVCECNSPKPKVVTKTVVKTVIKKQFVDREVIKNVPVEKAVVKEVPVEKIVYKADPEDYTRHELSLLLGGGPDGVKLDLYDSRYEFKKDYGVSAGLIYQYSVLRNFALGVGGFSNNSYYGVITLKK